MNKLSKVQMGLIAHGLALVIVFGLLTWWFSFLAALGVFGVLSVIALVPVGFALYEDQ